MSMTIGRASLSTNPYDLSLSGKTLTFSFSIVGTDVGHMTALRQQLAGLVDNGDETEVPFTWSEDSSLDGFYRVQSVNIPSVTAMLTSFYIPGCSITLEQLTGFAAPRFEVMTQAPVARTNGHAVTTPQTIIGYVSSFGAYVYYGAELRPSLTAATFVNRYAEGMNTGTDSVQGIVSTVPVSITQFSFGGVPATHYVGACKIEVQYGSTWYPLIGRQVPGALSTWRITNGTIRQTFSGGAGTALFESYSGSAWQTCASVVQYEAGGTGFVFGLTIDATLPQPEIVRNSPEQVIVRLSGNSLTYTYSLQRASRFIDISWSDATSRRYGLKFTSATASTTLTGGIRQTSNDANGNRMVLAVAAAKTTDLVNGIVYPTSNATSGSMMIGVEFAGSSANVVDAAAKVIEQWLGMANWRQRVVVR